MSVPKTTTKNAQIVNFPAHFFSPLVEVAMLVANTQSSSSKVTHKNLQSACAAQQGTTLRSVRQDNRNQQRLSLPKKPLGECRDEADLNQKPNNGFKRCQHHDRIVEICFLA